MEFKQNLLNSNKYGLKAPHALQAKYWIVHNTANDASAENEVAYMIRNNSSTSFHYAVDDKGVVQGVPTNKITHNCGNAEGNNHGISIEICYSKSGGERFIQAERNCAKFIAQDLKVRGCGIDKVKKHQDFNGKYCPHRTLDMGWQRFLNMIKAEMGEQTTPSPQSQPTTSNVNVSYCVRTQKHGWLPFVRNLEDYAGWENSPITDVAIKVDKGSIKYRVHVKGGKWLPYVTGCNLNDSNNGYAGDNKVIDCIEVYYYTPNDIRPFKRAKYRANAYPWQYDNEQGKGQDGYAGAMGVPMTKLQIVIE